MSQRRRYGEDLTVAEWHRNYLPELYSRRGHRLDMADRDWTEFCHWCKEPLVIWEEVLDREQSLNEKATTVTRRLAERAGIHAWLVAPRFKRSPAAEKRLAELHDEARQIEAGTVIHYFTAKRLTPHRTNLIRFTPDEFAREIHLFHSSHHHFDCTEAARSAPRRERITNEAALLDALSKSKLCVPQPKLGFVS